jgi:putative spermidine/putrescine transport system permease protein
VGPGLERGEGLIEASAVKKRSVGRSLAGLFHGRPRLQAGALLAGPVGWLVVGYLGSLAVLLVTSFWTLGELSGEIEQTFTLDNYKDVVSESVYRSITGRTVMIAALVTVTDILLAFPIAFYMAKVAKPRMRGVLVVAVLVPLWSAYLVKAFAWRGILSNEGVLNWVLDPLGISGPGYGLVAVWLVMSYIWLPYMIIPIYAGLERIPNTLLSASDDLGAKPGYTFRRVILPLVFPAVIAGSIFTFSLTLGDFITPNLVGSGEQFIGTLVVSNFTTNLPFAAAFAMVPIVIMIGYLLMARRFGAFEHL